jgi:hypothetical protein
MRYPALSMLLAGLKRQGEDGEDETYFRGAGCCVLLALPIAAQQSRIDPCALVTAAERPRPDESRGPFIYREIAFIGPGSWA